jgi:hypothetical protein
MAEVGTLKVEKRGEKSPKYYCPNCNCTRYNPCTCTRKVEKVSK